MPADVLLPFETCVKDRVNVNYIRTVNVDELSHAAICGQPWQPVRDNIMLNLFTEIRQHGFTSGIDDIDIAYPLLPTHIGTTDFEMYYNIANRQVFMRQLDKYEALLNGLNISHIAMRDDIFQPLFRTTDMNMLLPRLNTCAVTPGSNALSLYITWREGLASEFERLVHATGNSISAQTDFLRYLYPGDTILAIMTSKTLGLGLTYDSGSVSSLKYYLRYSQMDGDTLHRVEELIGNSISNIALLYDIQQAPYLVGFNILNDDIASTKVYFRDVVNTI